jgi:hypothetical protein
MDLSVSFSSDFFYFLFQGDADSVLDRLAEEESRNPPTVGQEKKNLAS